MKCWIIDDDPIARILIRKKLLKVFPNDALIEFNGAKEAESKLVSGETTLLPSLILLDLNMPVMSGWDFLDANRDVLTNHAIDVAILTSSIDESDQKKAQGYPCVACFLNKPLNLSTLEKHIQLQSKLE